MAGKVSSVLSQGQQLVTIATQLRDGGNCLAASLAFGEAGRVFATGPHRPEALSAQFYAIDALRKLVGGYQHAGDFAAATDYHTVMQAGARSLLQQYEAVLSAGEPDTVGSKEEGYFFQMLQGASYTALHAAQWPLGVQYADWGLRRCFGLRLQRPLYVARYGLAGGVQIDRDCTAWECVLHLVKGCAFLEGAVACCFQHPTPRGTIDQVEGALGALLMARERMAVATFSTETRGECLHNVALGLYRATYLLRYVAFTEPTHRRAERACATWRARLEQAGLGDLERRVLIPLLEIDDDYRDALGPELFRAAWYQHATSWSYGLDPVDFYRAALRVLDPIVRAHEERADLVDRVRWIEVATFVGRLHRRLGHQAEAVRFLQSAAEATGPRDRWAPRIDAEQQAARAGQVHALEDEGNGNGATVHLLPRGGRR